VNVVPTRWPGSTIMCIGGGPSLRALDVDLCHQAGLHVIAVNDAYKVAPWADVLYAADRTWIDAHEGVPSFVGSKYSIESHNTVERPDWTVLSNTGFHGLETDPSGLRTGFNSGYQAINLAVHLGAHRILLLGYDMAPADDGREHWFTDGPDRKMSPYAQMREAFDTLVEPISDLRVIVWNCSRRTALTAFPRVTLEHALSRLECAA
jgi:hypothetical protein